MACFNDEDRGVAIFSPAATEHWNFGPHREFKRDAKPTDGPCIHLAPIGAVNLGPKSALKYPYWLIVGSREEISQRLDFLMDKCSDEKLSLTSSNGKK